MPNNTNVKLAELKIAVDALPMRWRVDPRLGPGELVPRYSLGAEVMNLPVAAATPAVDLTPVLEERTNNPFLLARRRVLGFHADAQPPVPHVIIPHLPGGILPGPAEEPPEAGLAPSSVDWRTRWGWRWVTTVQDQNPCQSCWAFASTALVETMTRIEHAVWSKRSEGDVHDGIGKKCADLGNMGEALDWIKAHGICDPDCYPYKTNNPPYEPPPDRNGRTVKIGDYKWISSIADQKRWLDAVGPLGAGFTVYTDFFGYSSGVYRKTHAAWNKEEGTHLVLVVGYSDTEGCWICKNSWGPGWGDNGYFKIGYGQANVDHWAKVGLTGTTNPDPWTKRRLHAGAMVESGNGALHRNFELVVRSGSKLKHFWRDNNVGGFPWHAGVEIGNDAADGPALTATTFNRNFELVAVTTGKRLHHRYFSQSEHQWKDGGVFGPADAAGYPGLIQSDYGKPGNFELVVRTADGRLNHWWRIGRAPWTWTDGGRFASNVLLSGPTLVQTRNRKLHVVCVLNDGHMQLWERNDSGGFVWNALQTFGSGINSVPCMIEGQYSSGNEKEAGNYELVVARAGKMEHWWRYNGGDRQWRRSATFGNGILSVVALLEGSFGFNLEVVALRENHQLQHFWRDGGGWHDGAVIGSV